MMAMAMSDPLPHAATQLVRIALGYPLGGRDTELIEDFQDSLPGLCLTYFLMQQQDLCDLSSQP